MSKFNLGEVSLVTPQEDSNASKIVRYYDETRKRLEELLIYIIYLEPGAKGIARDLVYQMNRSLSVGIESAIRLNSLIHMIESTPVTKTTDKKEFLKNILSIQSTCQSLAGRIVLLENFRLFDIRSDSYFNIRKSCFMLSDNDEITEILVDYISSTPSKRRDLDLRVIDNKILKFKANKPIQQKELPSTGEVPREEGNVPNTKDIEGVISQLWGLDTSLNYGLLTTNIHAAFRATKDGACLSSLPATEETAFANPPIEDDGLPTVAPKEWKHRGKENWLMSPTDFIDKVYAPYKDHLTFKALERLDPPLARRYRVWVGSNNRALSYLPLPRQVRSQARKLAKQPTP